MKSPVVPMPPDFEKEIKKFHTGDTVVIPGEMFVPPREQGVKAVVKGIYPYVIVFHRRDVPLDVSFTKQEAVSIMVVSRAETPDERLDIKPESVAESLSHLK